MIAGHTVVHVDAAAVVGVGDPDAALLPRLRAGDEQAFRAVVRRHHATLVRVITTIVRRPDIAEELAQETWLAALRGLDGFEGRSTLRHWLIRIAVNAARARAGREQREVPASSLGDDDEPSLDPSRFQQEGRWVGNWSAPPAPWPDEALASAQTRAAITAAMAALPPLQAQVMTLRDGHGFDGPEVSELLGLSEANQRVLLHRARSKVRAALERRMRGES